MDAQDRQDRNLQRILGDNLMAGTMRLFAVIGVFSAIGGGVFWYLSRL
jgi:hypothetical protein